MEVPEKELKVVEKEVTTLYNAGRDFLVKNEEDKTKAAELRERIKQGLKVVEERRTAITKPINDSLKSINDLFRPFKDNLEKVVKHLDSQINLYLFEQEEIARKEQEKINRRVEKGTLKPETAVAKVEEIKDVKAPTTTSTGGKMITTKVPKFEVTDVNLLPKEYLMADEKKIAIAVVKLKLKEIPGVRIWEEFQLSSFKGK